MRSISQPLCPNCGSHGIEAYTGLRDHLYGAAGSWRMQRCASTRCGAYWSDPYPHPDDLPAAYVGYYTHQGHEWVGQETVWRKLLNTFSKEILGYPNSANWQLRAASRVVSLFPERLEAALYSHFYLPWIDGGSLLEIGCGSGGQLELLKKAGWNVHGVDFDPAAAMAARARGLQVDVGDIRSLNYLEASFDAIVIAHVIEHVYDAVGWLSECARLLKPGGRLISITPNAASLGHRIYKQAWRGLEPPRHLVVFTPQALRLAAERAGLNVDRVRVSARDAANMLLASSRIADAQSNEQILHPQANKRPPIKLRALAQLEWLADLCGLAWGEELVLMARKPRA